MASGFTVWTHFRAKGNLISETKRADSGLRRLGRTAQNVRKRIFQGAAIGGAAALAYGVREVKDEFVDLDQAITNSAAKWGSEFDRGTEGFNRLSEAAKQVGLTTEHQASVAATGLNFLAMAGFSAEEALALLPGVSNLATAANLDFATSSDVATDSLGAFGLAFGSPEQKADAFKQVMEQVAKTTNKTNTDITQWFEAVTDGAPSFTLAGQTMSTFNTAVGLLANNGIKGSKAGIALRGAMANLSKDSGRGADTLRKLNVEVKDSEGNFRDFADIIGDLESAMAGMGTRTATATMEKIFGKLQMSQMSILVKQGADKFREMRAEIEDSAGADVELASKMRKSVANSMKLVESALLGKGIDIVQALFGGEDPAEAITNLAVAIQNFDPSEIITVLKDVIGVVKDTVEWIYDNKETLLALGRAYGAFKIGSFISNLLQVNTGLAATGRGATAAATGVGKLATAFDTASTAMAAFAVGYAAGTFLWEQYEENQGLLMKRQNANVELDKKLARADFSQYKQANLEKLRALEAKELERAESDSGAWFNTREEHRQLRKAVKARKDSLKRIDRELYNRTKKSSAARAGAGSAIDTRGTVHEVESGLRASAFGAGQVLGNRPEGRDTTHTRVERKETQNNTVIDWGTPPAGVTVRDLDAGETP